MSFSRKFFWLAVCLAAGGWGLGPAARGQFVLTDCSADALRAAVVEQTNIRLACGGVITLSNRIRIEHDVTLDGTGAGVTLRGAGGDLLFQVATNAALTLINLTLADTLSTNLGTVFQNMGRILAEGCVFRANTNRGANASLLFPYHTATPGSGGVIYQWSNATFTATRCEFRNNAAVGGNGLSSGSGGSTWGWHGQGGVGYFNGGAAAFTDCLFAGNSAVGGRGWELGGGAFGGALCFGAASSAVLTNCVFSNNLAQTWGSSIPSGAARAEGGAVWSTGQVRAVECAFVNNQAVAASGAPAQGAGIHNEGSLEVATSLFRGNTAVGGTVGFGATSPVLSGGNAVGGALCTEGPAVVRDTAFEGNTAKAGAGGQTATGAPTTGGVAQGAGCNAFGANATLLLTNCGFVANAAQGGDGGQASSAANGGEARGAAVFVDGPATLVNCTVALSTNLGGRGGSSWSGGDGGGARGAVTFFSGTSMVAFCTIASNQVVPGPGAAAGSASGAALFNFNAQAGLLGNILAGSMGSTNLTGTYRDLGYNLCSDDSLALATSTSYTNQDSRLGPPAWNGGRGPTMALLPGSPALDAVPGAAPGLPLSDQRGEPRPCAAGGDIGAFELGAPKTCWLLGARSGADWCMDVFGEAGQVYRLLGEATLSSVPAWAPVSTNLAVSNGPVRVVISNGAPRQFYRAVTP